MESTIKSFLRTKFQGFKTKPIVFFGAGMSQRYLSSPNWKNLLKSFTHKLQPNNSYSWQCYKNQAEERIQEMGWSSNSLYPYIATLIRKEYNRKFFEDPSFEKELKESITDQEKVTDPFKFAVADYLQKTVQETETLHIEADKLLNLDSRVSNFITTNYDLFLELDRLPSSVNGLSRINSASNNAILESGREAPYVQEIAVQRPDFC